MKTRYILPFMLFVFLTGCAVAPKVVIPNHVIVDATKEQTVSRVTDFMINKGYVLRKTEPLVFECLINNVILRGLYSTGIDSKPIYRITVIITISEGSSSKVNAVTEAVSNSGTAMERVSRVRNIKDVNEMYAYVGNNE